jgi:hypothetical protein
MGIHFVDAEKGWVVGDHGTILYTQDGGENWLIQVSQTEAHLSGVYFVNSITGWAVGEQGVILSTNDGGEVWKPQTQDKTNLWSVYFGDAKTGWVTGENGTILFTLDGGKTWIAPASIDLAPPTVEKRVYIQPQVAQPPHEEAWRPKIGSEDQWTVSGQVTDKFIGSDRQAALTSQSRTDISKVQQVYHPSQSTGGRRHTMEVVPSIVQNQAVGPPFFTSDSELFIKLEKLHDLMKKNVITAEEYGAKKTDMLNFISANEQLFANLEKLHEFKVRGIIAAEEFEAKKAELLKKLI